MDILNIEFIWKICIWIVFFIVFWYIIIRLAQKRMQKKYWLNNFSVWVYVNLIDYYKDIWYPYPEDRALIEIKEIERRKNEECNKDLFDNV